MHLSRRQILTGVGAACLAAPIATASSAAEDADLDATVSIEDWQMSDREQIDVVELNVQNNEDRSIEPVFLCWCSTRITQQPWDRTRGPMTLHPGEVATYRIEAPKEVCSVRLRPNTVGNVAVYDKSTEQHESEQFIPEIDEERLGPDGQDTCEEYQDF
jgi:hypothetical protein